MPRTAQVNPDSPMGKAMAADEAHRNAVASVSSTFYNRFELKPHGIGVLSLSETGGEIGVFLDAESAAWLASQLIRIFGIVR